MKCILEKFSIRDKIIFASIDLCLSIIWTMGMQICFHGSVWGSPEDNFVRPINYITLIHFIFFFLLNGISLLVVRYINLSCNRKKGDGIRNKYRIIIENDKMFYIISLVLIIIAWFPYFLSYFPGGVFADTFNAIEQAYNMDNYGMHALNNHHPILYTLLWRVVILVSKLFKNDLYFAIILFLIIQFIAMISILAYLLVWIKNRSMRMKLTIISLAFVMFFPLFPLYAISLWKDTPFSLVLLLFIMCIADGVLEKELFTKTQYLFKFFLLGMLVSFTRNNGKYIIFLTMLILLLWQIKRLFQYKKTIISFCLLTTVIWIIQGPIYDKMGYNIDTATESLGIPLQQISYLVYYDYDLTEAEKDYIESIVSIDSIKERYNPCLFDSIKGYASDFKIGVIEENYSLFFKNYIDLVLRYPVGGIKAYMLATAGFWAPNIASTDGYIQNYVWDNNHNIKANDLFQKFFGVSFKDKIDSMKPISSAVFFLIIVYVIFVLILNRDYGKIIILLPAIANWITVMIATPIACSMRYVYILVLLIPIDMMIICISKKQ